MPEKSLTLATWNVNSLSVRLPHLCQWLTEHQPDVVCLQETKQEDHKFPYAELQALGYQAVHDGQKTYNGIAILSRHAITEIAYGIADLVDEQKRVLSATICGIRVVCIYVPNGQAVGSDKYAYKLNWLAHLNTLLRDHLSRYAYLAVLGDYNIAPQDIDCHDPSAWAGQILVSEAERMAFQNLEKLGLHDSFRHLNPDLSAYSWWDYRAMAFRRNLGMRIDHILVNSNLLPLCQTASIDRTPRAWERPSDHAPVVVRIQPLA